MAEKKFPLSPVGRSSFASVFIASSMEENQDKSYSLTLIFDKAAQASGLFAEMKKAAEKAAYDKWGDKCRGMKLRSPFRDAGEKSHLDGYAEGDIFVRFSRRESMGRPAVVDQLKRPLVDQAGFYSGCHAHVTYTVFAYETKGNKGVSFGLINVQKVRDDEPFAGATSTADDDFEEVTDGDTVAGLLG